MQGYVRISAFTLDSTLPSKIKLNEKIGATGLERIEIMTLENLVVKIDENFRQNLSRYDSIRRCSGSKTDLDSCTLNYHENLAKCEKRKQVLSKNDTIFSNFVSILMYLLCRYEKIFIYYSIFPTHCALYAVLRNPFFRRRRTHVLFSNTFSRTV